MKYADDHIQYWGNEALPEDGENWSDGELIALIADNTGIPAELIKLGEETWSTHDNAASGEWFVDGPHVDVTRER